MCTFNYYGNALWRIRGLLDSIIGGVGIRRGRRDPERLSPGETLDFWRVEAVEDDPLYLKAVYLAPTVPNPFANSTRITYAIPSSDGSVPVRLCVFDPAGRLIRTLVDDDRVSGIYEATWDGRNDAGAAAAGGIYFYQIRVNGLKQTKRGVLVR